jgi:hypothetical protein
MALIKVNGHTINPEKITMLARKSGERWSDEANDIEHYSGITVHFDAGGKKWIEDPTAEMIEAAFEDWDRDRPLPY